MPWQYVAALKRKSFADICQRGDANKLPQNDIQEQLRAVIVRALNSSQNSTPTETKKATKWRN